MKFVFVLVNDISSGVAILKRMKQFVNNGRALNPIAQGRGSKNNGLSEALGISVDLNPLRHKHELLLGINSVSC